MKDIEARTTAVHEYLVARLKYIKAIDADKEHRTLMQSILCTSFIDALGATRYGNAEESRDGFTKLIVEHSNWEHAQHICPIHLDRFLELNPGMPRMKKFTEAAIEEWKQGDPLVFLDQTPTKEELRHLWPNNGEQAYHSRKLESFNHVNLLYGLRNSLVHQQYAHRGLPCTKDELIKPQYVLWNRGWPDFSVELVHPAGFLINLSETLLDNVFNHFRETETAPWGLDHFSKFLMKGL